MFSPTAPQIRIVLFMAPVIAENSTTPSLPYLSLGLRQAVLGEGLYPLF
jgi:hypothetical protein